MVRQEVRKSLEQIKKRYDEVDEWKRWSESLKKKNPGMAEPGFRLFRGPKVVLCLLTTALTPRVVHFLGDKALMISFGSHRRES
jgi:hypothetical protein